MSPAWIRKRSVKVTRRNPRGQTFQVLYRIGGRGYPILSAGTFKTVKDANTRRDLVGGWLAAGKDPAVELAAIRAAQEPVRTYREWAEAYRASRIDVDDSTRKDTGSHLQRLLPIFEDSDPFTLTVADQIEAVAKLAAELKASSVSRYWSTHRLILDFAGVRPNPARDQAVKLPMVVGEEPQPPPAAHLLALLDKIPERRRLLFVVIEQTGMAIGETCQLTWGDVDEDGCQFRLRRATVKGRIRARARWVQVPEWLMPLISESCPLEDRTAERRVFQGMTPDIARKVMARACRAAKIPAYSPHGLRHRRLSLWHGQGVPAKELATRAGHAKASMSLDIYSHVMPLDEASAESLERLLVTTR